MSRSFLSGGFDVGRSLQRMPRLRKLEVVDWADELRLTRCADSGAWDVPQCGLQLPDALQLLSSIPSDPAHPGDAPPGVASGSRLGRVVLSVEEQYWAEGSERERLQAAWLLAASALGLALEKGRCSALELDMHVSRRDESFMVPLAQALLTPPMAAQLTQLRLHWAWSQAASCTETCLQPLASLPLPRLGRLELGWGDSESPQRVLGAAARLDAPQLTELSITEPSIREPMQDCTQQTAQALTDLCVARPPPLDADGKPAQLTVWCSPQVSRCARGMMQEVGLEGRVVLRSHR